MRNWIFAAIIGLSICNQALAWDDEDDFFDHDRRNNKRNHYSSLSGDPEIDRNIRDMRNERAARQLEELVEIEKKRLKMEKDHQDEILKIEKDRLWLEEQERNRRVIDSIGR